MKRDHIQGNNMQLNQFNRHFTNFFFFHISGSMQLVHSGLLVFELEIHSIFLDPIFKVSIFFNLNSIIQFRLL